MPLNISVPNAGFFIVLKSNSTSNASVIVENVTGKAPLPPSGFTPIGRELNISVNTSANITAIVALAYPCSVPVSEIVPFILVNGAWAQVSQFTANTASCTISFSMPKDPVVGLFQKTQVSTEATTAPAPATSAVSQNQTATPAQPQNTTGPSYAAWAIVAVIIIAVVAAWLASRRRKHW